MSHTNSDTHGSLMSINKLSFDDENKGQGTLTTLGKDGPAGDGGSKSSTIDENGTVTVKDSETALEGSTLNKTSRGADSGNRFRCFGARVGQIARPSSFREDAFDAVDVPLIEADFLITHYMCLPLFGCTRVSPQARTVF